MTSFIGKWSVASVFNEWGVTRFEHAYDYGITGNSFIHQHSKIVNKVANCIRELGYKVVIVQSFITCVYVIISISKKDEKGNRIYYYGVDTKSTPEIYGGHVTSLGLNTLINNYPLSGYRTIYEKPLTVKSYASKFFGNFENSIENISELFDTEFSKDVMKTFIDNGSICNKKTNNKLYMNGVSTIGNTLPNDIVEALRDFRCDDPKFTTEPDYEFYIPHSMLEIKTCPVEEDVLEYNKKDILDHGSVCCPGLTGKVKDHDTVSSSSDSEIEE